MVSISAKKGLGHKFLAEVRNKNSLLRQNPLAYAIRYGNVRTANLDIFPFMIHFTIEEHDTLLISAILHTKLDSSSWPVR